MHGINTTKLLILAILGFCAVVLGSAVLTLQLYVTQEKQKLGLLVGGTKGGRGNGSGTSRSRSRRQTGVGPTTTMEATSAAMNSVRPSEPISKRDIRLQHSYNYPPPQGRSAKVIQQSYWRQVAAILQDWDVLLQPAIGEDADGTSVDELLSSDDESSLSLLLSTVKSTSTTTNIDVRWMLRQAADAGHPIAQHYLANAYASGIWPTVASGNGTTFINGMDDNDVLHVFDEWSPSPEQYDGPDQKWHRLKQKQQQQQLTKAFMLWHMAAIGGNIESAMALANRIGELPNTSPTATVAGTAAITTSTATATTTTATTASKKRKKDSAVVDHEQQLCSDTLPYFEAAAHGIMDVLEASPNSRAKVVPPMDNHILAKVHMRGGTSNQEWHNNPHAIQFYHLKATTAPWSTRLLLGRWTTTTSSSSSAAAAAAEEPSIDVNAAYTLAQLYHQGWHGVPQNLTQSLIYYEIAARYGHWESAGEAGTFHLWGMGTHQNVHKALEYFEIGTHYGLEGCRRKHEQSLLQQKKSKSAVDTLLSDVHECDATSLNGMGVLHLLGIPDKIMVNMTVAEKYFTLAKELGNADAMYHLAMMWMGWKTHFKAVSDLKDDGMSSVDDTDAFPDGSSAMSEEEDAGTKTANRKPPRTATFALHYSPRTRQLTKGPNPSDIQEAIKLLTVAANKGHLQSKHRLAMMYSEGISIQTEALQFDAVKPSCAKAKALYQWITENASPQRSKRLRVAYKAYTEGKLETALRNYLAAGETGSHIGQVNAAFLLERGTCLGLSRADCAKASVRLWKAAAVRNSTEACLRVGDFYYYGRLRANTYSKIQPGPFGWVQYLLYPEQYLPELLQQWTSQGLTIVRKYLSDEYASMLDEWMPQSVGPMDDEVQHQQALLDADLSLAAHYYTIAAERHQSPRAFFNLGFMYEWGIGMKQDFPLAKRNYDLAVSVNANREAETAVQIALWTMTFHQHLVKLYMSWQDWQKEHPSFFWSSPSPTQRSALSSPEGSGVLSSPGLPMGKKVQEVILSHLFNWSSLLVVVLLYAVLQLQTLRNRLQQRRR